VWGLAGGTGDESGSSPQPSLFYPPLPNQPRVQFLTSINDTGFVTPGKSGFFRFIFGEDKEKEDVRPIIKPYGVAVHEGRIYVCDLRGGLIMMDMENQESTRLGTSEPGALTKPVNIDIHRDGTLYVADIGREQILAFDRDGTFIRAYGRKDEFRPADVLIHRTRIYVADIAHHQVVIMDAGSGEIMSRIGKAGSKEGELFHPTNLALDSLGNLYVSETSNFRISVFGPDGDFVRTFGQIGREPGSFARNKGIAVDRQGNFWVVDAAFENVQVFNSKGQLLLHFLGPGQDRGNINLPVDIWLDYDNIQYFRQFADPKFRIECLVFVSSQFGPNKINVYAHGTYTR